MIENKPHSIRKRLISSIYLTSSIQSSSELHLISQLIVFGRLLPILDWAATDNQAIDVFEMNFSAAMDFIVAFLFGVQNATNFTQEEIARTAWLKKYQISRPRKPDPSTTSQLNLFISLCVICQLS